MESSLILYYSEPDEESVVLYVNNVPHMKACSRDNGVESVSFLANFGKALSRKTKIPIKEIYKYQSSAYSDNGS